MPTDLLTQLKTLHLYGMAEAWAEIQAEIFRQPKVSAEVLMRRLLQAETTERQARSLRYQLNAAKFPIYRDFVNFNWQETPLSLSHIEQLASTELPHRRTISSWPGAPVPAKRIWQPPLG